MGNDTNNGTAVRTVEQVRREVDEARVRLSLLEWELRMLKNPNGPTFADLEGIWAGATTSDADIEASKFRVPAKLEQALAEDAG